MQEVVILRVCEKMKETKREPKPIQGFKYDLTLRNTPPSQKARNRRPQREASAL